MQILATDPQVQAAIISSTGTVIAAIIAAIIAAVVGKKISDRQRLIQYLKTAQQDIDFLLSVEQVYCDMFKQIDGTSPQRKIRACVRDEGKTWSGKFTPSRIRQRQLD